MNGNRPALNAVSYRLGTYEDFRRRILDGIAGAVVNGAAPAPGLRALLTRRDDDYAITLVDLWAAVAEILSFYQERYANETFLRTARTVESVIGLAALANPELSPTAATAGSAAIARLAFTVAADVTVPAGLRVQSQGGAPQVFETFADVAALASLNRLRVHPPPVDQRAFRGDTAVLDPTRGPILSGQLKAGASVVLFNDSAVEEKTVAGVAVAGDRVTVKWKTPVVLPAGARAFRRLRAMRLFGWNTPATYAVPQAAADRPDRTSSPSRLKGIDWQLVQLQAKDFVYPSGDAEQPAPLCGSPQTRFCLDGVYPGLAPGGQILVADLGGGHVTLYDVCQVDQTTDAFGALSGPATRVWAHPSRGGVGGQIGDRRQVVVYELAGDEILPACTVAGSDWRPKPEDPVTAYVDGRAVAGHEDRIEVGLTIAGGQFQPGTVVSVDDLPADRQMVLSDGAGGAPEAVRLLSKAIILTPPPRNPNDPPDPFRQLVLTLDMAPGTAPAVDPASAVAMGNLGAASHGQTVRGEVLGSSSAAPFQTFTLKRQPLAFVPTPDGRTTSSLHVFVDGVEWREVPTLTAQPASAQVFTSRPGDGGSVVVAFGDGVTGRVPPAGRSNVTATYRVGGGPSGNVAAGALTSLLDRPAGLLAAINPLPASGGRDGGAADVIRADVGAAVRTIGRAVSLRDFEDLAVQGGGVASAHATVDPGTAGAAVTVSVVTVDGQPLTPAAKDRIGGALAGRFDPTFALTIADAVTAGAVAVPVHARLTLRPDALRSQVLADAARAIQDLFASGAGPVGPPPEPGAVVTALQRVPGVAGAVLIGYDPAPTAGAVPVAGELTFDAVGGLAGER